MREENSKELDRIEGYLKSSCNSTTTKKAMRVIMEFRSVDEFLASGESEWAVKYKKARPESKVDLGKVTVAALNGAISYVKEVRRLEKVEEANRRKEEEQARIEAERAEQERKAKDERENPKFTISELTAITSFMTICDIEAIDLKGLRQFLSLCNAKINVSNGNG